MLPEFTVEDHNSTERRIATRWRLDAEAGLSEPRSSFQECKEMCTLSGNILCCFRYLFPWFGFNATEFTCANLETKGEPL
jgi:hypothetical protein